MARNEEKNVGVLNRLYLQSYYEEQKKKKRPPLHTLSTAAEVRKWIPHIKGEINFCLHHLSGVRNYPEYKINEFKDRLEYVKKEYRKWVNRVLELDPDYIGTPGDHHAYISKRKREELLTEKHERMKQK
eukprot:TRINITY_DN3469_c0_g1_i1.p1 TRINITY_DN3469_c0_g1~~TRINITY_DN3469_c0_g1_i1.p1  ORF type:complete len:144 (+),score=27.66 TRINITY_DN3469_c0_g1_i1:46-432(+)